MLIETRLMASGEYRIIENGRTRKRRRGRDAARQEALNRAHLAWRRGEDRVEVDAPGLACVVETTPRDRIAEAIRAMDAATLLRLAPGQTYLEAYFSDRDRVAAGAIERIPARTRHPAGHVALEALCDELARHPVNEAARRRLERRREIREEVEARANWERDLLARRVAMRRRIREHLREAARRDGGLRHVTWRMPADHLPPGCFEHVAVLEARDDGVWVERRLYDGHETTASRLFIRGV